jgi:phosphoribosylaminoimidazolecarboxamide formyltransferase/IMP cyclohydrolase
MSASHISALAEANVDLLPVRRALLSVSDKSGLVEFARGLAQFGAELISTGGTSKALAAAGLNVTGIEQLTGFPEILDGRVKTLHPKVHGGLLGRPDIPEHAAAMADHGIQSIDLVCVNLYPFEQTIARPGIADAEAIENIDIGGPSMVRSAAKNFAFVAIVTDPSQYAGVLAELKANGGRLSLATRRRLAGDAYALTSRYDTAIAAYFRNKINLKYGCNPHQKNARVVLPSPSPLQVLNGEPGYINVLDTLGAWQLVRELRRATGKPAAASFKHVSPAGAAIARPLADSLRAALLIEQQDLSPVALAYARARGGDRLCSFGDVVAVSETVDASLAEMLRREVSDLIVAPDFEPDALRILRQKKGGEYIILKMDPDYEPPQIERRELFGLTLEQDRNNAAIAAGTFAKVVADGRPLTPEIIETLVVATIALKYTQSNSVCLAFDGQVIGMGAGQQSRIHCTRLACGKADKWLLQQHPQVLGLRFKAGLKRPEKANVVDQYLLLDELSEPERAALAEALEEVPPPLTPQQRRDWIASFDGICLSSDAFFPFRDNIDRASRSNVQFVAHPGGSIRDDTVLAAARQYRMTLIETGVRCFLH